MAEELHNENSPVFSSPDGVVISDRPAGISCPRCDAEMVFGELARTKVVVCGTCHGVAVQCAVFGELIDHLRRNYEGVDDPPRPIDQSQLEVVAICPACGGDMEVHPYGGPGTIVIDSCTQCHIVWLDGSELTRIIRGPGRR